MLKSARRGGRRSRHPYEYCTPHRRMAQLSLPVPRSSTSRGWLLSRSSFPAPYDLPIGQEPREGIANPEKEKHHEEDRTASYGRCRSVREEGRRSRED